MKSRDTFLKILLLALALLQGTAVSAQWQPVKPPNSGGLSDFEFYGDKLYAASASAVYRSTNLGLTWDLMFTNPGPQGDTKLFIDQGKLMVIWGSNMYWLQETPDGLNGVLLHSGLEADALLANGVLYRMDYQSNIFVDGQYSFTLSGGDYGFFKKNGQEVWLGTDQGIYRTADQGVSWDTIQSGWDIAAMDFYGDTIFVSTANSTYHRSFDGGQTWSNMASMNGYIAYHYKLLDGKLYALAYQLFVSENMGTTWSIAGPSYQNRDLMKVGDLMLALNAGGFSRSINNGGFWVSYHAGLQNPDLPPDLYFKLRIKGNNVAARYQYFNGGLYDREYYSNSKGLVWKAPFLDPEFQLEYVTFHEGNYYAFDNFDNKFFKSLNDVGGPWAVMNTVGFPPTGLGMLSANEGLYAWDYNTLYRSTNGGQNWSVVHTFSAGIDGYLVHYHNGHLFASVAGIAMRSEDMGATWVALQNTGLPVGDFISLETLESRDGLLYVPSAMGGLYVSSDHGDQWTVIDNGLQALIAPCNCGIHDLIVSEAGLLVDNSIDLVFSPDFGQTWGYFNDSLPDIYTTGGVATNDAFYIAGFDGSLWRRDFSTANLSVASGKVYYDANASGNYNDGEPGIPDALLHNQDGSIYVSSNTEGDYAMYAQSFSGDTAFVNLPSPYLTSNPPFHVLVNGATDLDFGINYIPGIKDLSVTLTNAGPIRPGFQTYLTLTLTNYGTTVQSGEVTLTIDDRLVLESSSPSLTSFSGGVALWEFSGLFPLEQRNYTVLLNTPVDMPLGEVIGFLAIASPVFDDETIVDNVYLLNMEVVGSYDPNFKEVTPGGLTPSMLQDSTAMAYTVHFQNVGNYPASFVEIIDTISTNLDLATFRILSASHPFTWELLPGRVLRVFYEDINLPDSTSNEAASHGFVKYSIRPLRSLSLGDRIDNTAYIYFDFNAPVITNTTTTKVALTLGDSGPKSPALPLAIAPNPTSGFVEISLPKLGAAITGEAGHIEVLSALGQSMYRSSFQGRAKLDTVDWPSGLYFVVVALSDAKVYGGRFVKE